MIFFNWLNTSLRTVTTPFTKLNIGHTFYEFAEVDMSEISDEIDDGKMFDLDVDFREHVLVWAVMFAGDWVGNTIEFW